VILIATGGTEPISASLSPYFLAPPPLGPVLIAGFLAPRASWLLGGLLGMIAIVATLIVVSSPTLQASATGTAGAGVQPELLAYSVLVSAVGGGFYAASAAWYRRFLAMASPNRNAARPARPGGQNRRDANNRPLLTRRR
jgi:hypothetical protein